MDPDERKIQQLNAGIPTIYEENLKDFLQTGLASKRLTFSSDAQAAVNFSNLMMICVGTPTLANGLSDLRYVQSVVDSIVKYNLTNEYKLIIEKSTLPVGSHKQLKEWIRALSPAYYDHYEIASNPEFLREGKAIDDFLQPDRIICGTSSERATELLKELYHSFIKAGSPILFTSVASAELIKQAANSFLAMKISYANMLAEICERVDANIGDVSKGIGLDSRIGSQFLQAGIGYGGSCFPKDIAAFIRTGEELGLNLNLLRETTVINTRQRDRLVSKIISSMGNLHNKQITLLGLAFKPDTDDVRETPANYIARELLGHQAKLKLYDPIANENFKLQLQPSDNVSYASSLIEAITHSHAIILLTAWEEFLLADYRELKSHLADTYFFDARNALNKEQLLEAGYRYINMG